MKKKLTVLLAIALLMGLGFVGVTYAQTMPQLPNDMQEEPDEPYSDPIVDIQAVCSGMTIHPELDRLAENYEDVEYDDLLVYFCDYEFGIGEIRHALSTAELEDVDYTYEELLEWRYDEGMKEVGWGEIWQALGLIGMDMVDFDDDDDVDEFDQNVVCSGEKIHPALDGLAESFEVEYPELLAFFCEQNFGVGEIKHALETAQQEDVELSYDEILEMRSKGDQEGMGWGRIWQELGLIGRGKPDKGESIEYDENMLQEQNENNKWNDRQVVPPGKGRGPKK